MSSSAPAPSTPTDHPVPAMAPAPSPTTGPSTPAACASAAQAAPGPSDTASPMAPSTDTPSARASTRIAARKRTAADLADVRRQKKRLVVNKEAAAAAAALATAFPLGPRASSDDPSVPAARTQTASAPQDPTTPSTSDPLISASTAAQAAPVAAPARTLAALLAAPEKARARTTPPAVAKAAKSAKVAKAPKPAKAPKGLKTVKPAKAAKTAKPVTVALSTHPSAASLPPPSATNPEATGAAPVRVPVGTPQATSPMPAGLPTHPQPRLTAVAPPPSLSATSQSPAVPIGRPLSHDRPPVTATPTPCATAHTATATFGGCDSDSDFEELLGAPPAGHPPALPSGISLRGGAAARSALAHNSATPASPARAMSLPPPYSAFDLSDFLGRFHAGASATPSPPRPPQVSTPASRAATRVAASSEPALMATPCSGDLQPLLAEFTRFLQQRATADTAVRELLSPYSRGSDSVHTDMSSASWTLPNERGVLPPGPVCNLRASDFPPPAYRTRGDFVPAAVHMLAAHRLYTYLLSPEGLHTTPMAFLLRMRLLDSLRFLDAPPILGASYSARFGRYGVTIMHFLRANLAAQLLAGSTDANFSLDFGANVAPPAPPACASYHDLLGAIQGLTTFANAEWYEPMTHPLYRLREFVTANMDADPGNTPQRVQRTLHEVNQFLGATFVHLSSDSPAWWRDFCAASHRITFSSASWAIALCANIAPVSSAPTSDNNQAPRADNQRRVTREHGPRAAQSHPSGIPAQMRALIPRNAEGQEPCLRFFAGSMCFGGTTSTCAVRNRLHSWPEELPAALLAFIKKKFSHRDSNQRRRA